jgi:hypothetical protein
VTEQVDYQSAGNRKFCLNQMICLPYFISLHSIKLFAMKISQKEADKYGNDLNYVTEKHQSWFRSISLISSSLFGIMVSLKSNDPEYLFVKIVYCISIFLLGAGSIFACVHTFLNHKIHERSVFADILRDRSGGTGRTIVNPSRLEILPEKISIVILILSSISLIAYSILACLFHPESI